MLKTIITTLKNISINNIYSIITHQFSPPLILTTYIIIIYTSVFNTAYHAWRISKHDLTKIESTTQTKIDQLNQCHLLIKKNSGYPINNLLDHNNQSSIQDTPLSSIQQYLHKNKLHIEKYSSKNHNQGNVEDMYYVYGNYEDIKQALKYWNKHQFIAWINELTIQKNSKNSGLLQLKLLLEKTHA